MVQLEKRIRLYYVNKEAFSYLEVIKFKDGQTEVSPNQLIDVVKISVNADNVDIFPVLYQIAEYCKSKPALIFTYLIGLRGDKNAFTNQTTENFVNSVILPLLMHLNSKEFSLYIYTPHTTLFKEYPYKVLIKTINPIEDLTLIYNGLIKTYGADCTIVGFPDRSAHNRFEFPYNLYFVINKKRVNNNGDTRLEHHFEPETLSGLRNIKGTPVILFVDDLCDGGRTFTSAAELIKKEIPEKEFIFCLFVTHFVGGDESLKNLNNHFDVFIYKTPIYLESNYEKKLVDYPLPEVNKDLNFYIWNTSLTTNMLVGL